MEEARGWMNQVEEGRVPKASHGGFSTSCAPSSRGTHSRFSSSREPASRAMLVKEVSRAALHNVAEDQTQLPEAMPSGFALNGPPSPRGGEMPFQPPSFLRDALASLMPCPNPPPRDSTVRWSSLSFEEFLAGASSVHGKMRSDLEAANAEIKQLRSMLGRSATDYVKLNIESTMVAVAPDPSDVIEDPRSIKIVQRWEELVRNARSALWNRYPIRDSWAASIRKCKIGTNDMYDDALFTFDAGRPANSGSGILRFQLSSAPRMSTGFIMHPHSKLRIAWMVVGMILMAYDLVKLSLSVFDPPAGAFTAVMEMFGNVYWTMDIFVSFSTGVFVEGRLSLEPSVIACHYFKSWFTFDTLIVGCQWFFVFVTTAKSSSLSIVRYVRLMRFSRVVRMIKLITMLPAILAAVTSPFNLLALEIAQFLIGMLWWMHFSACGFFYMEGNSGNELLDAADGILLKYLLCAHWAAAQMQGSVDVTPGMVLHQRVYAVIVIMMSIPFCALFISRLTNILMELHELTKKNATQTRRVKDYVNRHRISAGLSVRIQQFLKFKQCVDAFTENRSDEEVLKLLPTHLKGALLEESLWPLLSKHCVFRTLYLRFNAFFKCLCLEAFSTMFVLPEEMIFHYGTVPTQTFLVESGEVVFAHYSPIARSLLVSLIRDSHAGTNSHLRQRLLEPRQLINGRCVSEMALWTRSTHGGDLGATAQASIVVVDVERFEMSAAKFPSLQLTLARHATRFTKGLKKACDDGADSDLFTSLDLQDPSEKAVTPRPSTSSNRSSIRSAFSSMAGLTSFEH
eukprot:TRINITY_DN73591_c0_g1_i1.p1 TRINITY_DN73591_c0_g1~~TRINITY_DN73591_c0_g1_i1.p1  ORF type:complete len:856 (-),score=125.64 TRINITY_DN73591_c0_g1_i1:44-2428(-)